MEIRFDRLFLYHEDMEGTPNAFMIEVYRKKTNTIDWLCMVPNGCGDYEYCSYHALGTLFATSTTIENTILNKSHADLNTKIQDGANLDFSSHSLRTFAINKMSWEGIPKEWNDLRVGHGTPKQLLKDTSKAYLRSTYHTDVPCAIVLAEGYAVKKGVGNCPDFDSIPIIFQDKFKRLTYHLFSTVTNKVNMKILYMLSCILVMYHFEYKDKYGDDASTETIYMKWFNYYTIYSLQSLFL